MRDDLAMASDSEAARQLDRAQQASQAIWQRLLDLEGVASGAGVTRLLFEGYDGAHPRASTVATWFGVKRFSIPKPKSSQTTYLLTSVGRLLDPGTATELKLLWEEVPKLRDDRNRVEGHRSARPRDYLDPPSTGRRMDLEWGVHQLLDEVDGPASVRELDLLTRFKMGSARTGSKVPAYVKRTADDALRGRIDQALRADPEQWQDRIVLASGPPVGGKTRSVLEALIDMVPGALLLVKRAKASIGDLAAALLGAQRENIFADPEVVVFVDDLHLLEGHGSNLGVQFRRLLEGPRKNDQRLILVGTIHERFLSGPDRHARPDGFGRAERELLASVSTHYSDEFDPSEEFAANETFPDFLERADIGATGLHQLPAWMASVDLLMDKINEAKDDPEGYVNDCLVHAALDIGSLDSRGGGSYSLFRDLTDRWVQERYPTRPRVDDAEFKTALTWATAPTGKAWAILNPVRGEFPDDDRYRLLDALSDQLLPGHQPREWLEKFADQWQLIQLAWSHFDAGRGDAARRILTCSAQAGNAYAMFSLADLLREFEEYEEAKIWTLRAAEAGEIWAMTEAGQLLRNEGDLAGAERWFIRAVDEGDTQALVEIALLREAQGDLVGAAEWYERTELARDPRMIYNAGVMYRESGDLGEAERCFRKAARSGYDFATNDLGMLLAERGDIEEAERLFRSGVEQGNATSMSNLGVVFSQRGELGEAEAWYRRAAEGGNPSGMFNLGVSLERQGGLDQAMEWYHRAAAEGNADAINRLVDLMEPGPLA